MDDDGLQLHYSPGRNGSGTMTATLNGDVVAVDTMNIARDKARQAFAERLCEERPGIDREAVEEQLLQEAARVTSERQQEQPGADLAEVDASAIVRPERIITPDLSAITIPMMLQVGDGVRGRWTVYIRWQDGKRERRPLGPMLDLPDGRRLYVVPIPGEPPPSVRPGWSAEARKRWLAGEAAPEPVDVFKRVCQRIAHFLDVPAPEAPGITATLACWVILTYAYCAWPAVPYLYVGGPLGSGKSRVFEILARLVFRPLVASNMTAASLFRTLHTSGGALLLDEAERLRKTNDPDVKETLSMLLAGYKRGGCAVRLEFVGDSEFRSVTFDVYGPKALACISVLPPALASRAITITMFRAAPGSEKPRRRIDGDPATWQRLRDELHALALEHGPTFLRLIDRVDVCPDEMSGRDFELWQPLLAIATWLDDAGAGAGGLADLLRDHALATLAQGKDDETPDHDHTLLGIVAQAIRLGERPTPGDILDRAKASEPEAFKRWTARAVSEHLKRYGLTTNKTGGSKRYARVSVDDLERIETNYGIDLGMRPG